MRKPFSRDDEDRTVYPCPEPARPAHTDRRAYPFGITVSPDEWFPDRFALKLRKTPTEHLRVGDLSLEELWELHHELGHVLAVLSPAPKGDPDA